MWSNHAQIRVRAVDLQAGLVDAEHFGYQRLAEPVTHRRWLLAPPDHDAVLVVDLLSGTGRHQLRTSWPLHPSVDVQCVSGGHSLWRNGSEVAHLAVAATAKLRTEEVRGDERGNLGWWSNRLESREPSWLVGSRCFAELPVAIVTVIQSAANGRRVADLSVSHHGSTIEASWKSSNSSFSATVDTTLSGRVEFRSEPLGS
jgi:hypothetical protein